jgi:arsenite oxidase small subunit
MKSCDRLIDVGRRQFLRGTATAAAGGVAAALVVSRGQAAPPLARVAYPHNRLANLKDLKVDQPVPIAYPDQDSPGVLLKLGRAVKDGVGPGRDVVAFSTLCPHKGFPLNYVASDKSFNCPGHYSRFDCENGGQQIWGQATMNLAQFKLVVEQNGDIFAVGCDEQIYGRISNVLR